MNSRGSGVFGEWENPYLTMNYRLPGDHCAGVREVPPQGIRLQGKKPVHWCATCQDGLGGGGGQIRDHRSPSIYVKFRMVSSVGKRFPALKGNTIFVIIWTTTPWTIPANLAIALHPDVTYVAAEVDGEVYIVAGDLLEEVMKKIRPRAVSHPGEILGCHAGRAEVSPSLLGAGFGCSSLAPYVTLEAGTGCVHTAPGHGQEDYESGVQYGLDIYSPVDDDGRFTEDVPFFAGQFVFDANGPVIEKLKEVGALLRQEMMEHSYPHCWRTNDPIIFRATEQWFISMEKNGLRPNALKSINEDLDPSLGKGANLRDD